jgi:hypothetical protein
MSNNTSKISILLPTRGRTEQLDRSVSSLINSADDPAALEWLFAFDSDDTDSYTWFAKHVLPKIKSSDALYTCLQFEPVGYENLHFYINTLAKKASSDWFVFWNDDAVMNTAGWDTVINSYNGRFCLQAFDTHNHHPYSIFPIVPRTWFEIIGHLSQHQLTDAWLSQIAWLLDIVVRIDVNVEHERFDLSGKNNDDTFKRRQIFEGDPSNPRDFNYITHRQARLEETIKLAEYLKQQGHELTHWQGIQNKTNGPWDKMMAADVNGHLKQYQS